MGQKISKRKSGVHTPLYCWITSKNKTQLRGIAFLENATLDDCVNSAIELWLENKLKGMRQSNT